MSEALFVDLDKHLEIIDKWRESREEAEELKYSLATAEEQHRTVEERIKIAASELKKNKSNNDIVEECIILFDMLLDVFNKNHDIKKN